MINGKIFDKSNEEIIPFVNVYFSDNKGNPVSNASGIPIGTTSNEDGYYSINSPFTGNYVTASAVGYEKLTLPKKDLLHFRLKPKTILLAEFEVVADRIKKFDWQSLIPIVISILIVVLVALSIKRK